MAETQYKNLAFEGGGVRGIAYVGALLKMDEVEGLLESIEQVAGTSAGSIVALLTALQYTPDQINGLMWELDFNRFKSGWNPVRIAEKYGLYDGEYALETFRKFVRHSPLRDADGNPLSPDATFNDLYAANQQWEADGKGTARTLHVFAASLTYGGLRRLSHDCSPDVSIAKAVRASMSIPLFFEVMKIGDEMLVDGGTVYNYPITAFDFTDPPCRVPEPNTDSTMKRLMRPLDQTLGLYFEANASARRSLKDGEPLKYLEALIGTVLDAQHVYVQSNDDVLKQTVLIDTDGIKATDFGITRKEKKMLWKNGYQAVERYFSTRNGAGYSLPSHFAESSVEARLPEAAKEEEREGDG